MKGQCALLAGYGIQGEVLANVLYKSSTLIMVPRVNLALRLKYLYGELGCTPEVSHRCSPCSLLAISCACLPKSWKQHLAWDVRKTTQILLCK